MRIAIDNHVSSAAVQELKSKGISVVLFANDRADIDWVKDAVELNVDAIVSSDLDVPNILDKMGSKILWIDIPQKTKYREQYKIIIKELKKVLKEIG